MRKNFGAAVSVNDTAAPRFECNVLTAYIRTAAS